LYLILRGKQKLRILRNRVLRRVFGLKREQIIGGWRKLRNEELHNTYSSSHVIRLIKSRRMKLVGHKIRMRETRNAYRVWMGKP
jgi:hypothetical protein